MCTGMLSDMGYMQQHSVAMVVAGKVLCTAELKSGCETASAL
jgi:hypothetical protein